MGADGVGTKVDDKVRLIINPGINWGLDERCQQSEFQILGMPGSGTFAQYTSVPSKNVYVAPAHLTGPECAALPLAGLTAFRGLFVQGDVKKYDKVLITGAGGGVATIAIKMALAAGANVYVNSSSDYKISSVVNWGCEMGWNYLNDKDWVAKCKRETEGLDFIFDGAGGDTIKNYIDLLKPGGQMVAYGATLGPWTNVPAAKIFWKQIHISGTTMGSDRDFVNMLDFVTQYKIRPHIDRIYGLDEANEALQYLSSDESFGKIILKIPFY